MRNDTAASPLLPLIVQVAADGDPDQVVQAERLAARLRAPLFLEAPDLPEPPDQPGLVLRLDGAGLALGEADTRPEHMLRADFRRLLPRLRPGNLQQELLVRAARIRGAVEPVAIDATAGLGEDALLLAAAGFRVQLYENNPLIAALLADGLARAARLPELAALAARMHLHEADSIPVLPALAEPPDVVLLDPMFPPRRKSAQVKKKLQMLQQVERPCADEAALMQAALAARPRKIVIKRPVHGPWLAGIRPGYTLAGKAVRFDCVQVRA